MPFVILKQIEEDNWYLKIDQNEKPKFRSFVQIDIISKIMMLIEDLAILSESFRSERNFYDVIYSSVDLGEEIEKFFQKINNISDDEIYKIMNYATPNQIKLDEKSMKLLSKHLNSNVKEIRRFIGQVGEFGNSNHALFKRFKHAGMPLFFGDIRNLSPGFLEGFEFCNIVSNGSNPFRDVLLIPYSRQALEGYQIIINGLHFILKDMIENRIICIQRGLAGLIPTRRYDLSNLSPEEVSSMKKIVDDFYAINPPTEIAISHNYNLTIAKEKILWYLNLREF
jgi:hypothetical protein